MDQRLFSLLSYAKDDDTFINILNEIKKSITNVTDELVRSLVSSIDINAMTFGKVERLKEIEPIIVLYMNDISDERLFSIIDILIDPNRRIEFIRQHKPHLLNKYLLEKQLKQNVYLINDAIAKNLHQDPQYHDIIVKYLKIAIARLENLTKYLLFNISYSHRIKEDWVEKMVSYYTNELNEYNESIRIYNEIVNELEPESSYESDSEESIDGDVMVTE